MASHNETSYAIPAKTLGTWLRDARKAKNLYVRQIAALADIEPSHLNKVENDKRLPTTDSLERLAAAYGVNLAELKRRVIARKLLADCDHDHDLAAAAAAQLQEDAAAYGVNNTPNKL